MFPISVFNGKHFSRLMRMRCLRIETLKRQNNNAYNQTTFEFSKLIEINLFMVFHFEYMYIIGI